jgi:tetratricopeptide (TPR) repeat protein
MAVIVRQHVAYPSSTLPTFRRLPHALKGWQPGLGLNALQELKRSWPVAWEWAQGLDSQERPRTLNPTFPIFQNTQGSSDEFTSALRAWSMRLPDRKQGTPMDHATANLATDIGIYLLTKKMFSPALEHLRWATEISPQVHSRWTNLGVGLSAIGQLETAIEVTKHALRLKGDDRTALTNLARYYIGLRDWKKSLVILDDLLANRAGPLPLGLRGVVMANQANYEEAKQMFTRALAMDPSQPEARAGLLQLRKMNTSTP